MTGPVPAVRSGWDQPAALPQPAATTAAPVAVVPTRRQPSRAKPKHIAADRAWLCFDRAAVEGIWDGIKNLRVLDAEAMGWIVTKANRCGGEPPWDMAMPLLGPDDADAAAGWRRICRGWRFADDFGAVAAAIAQVEGLEWVDRVWKDANR